MNNGISSIASFRRQVTRNWITSRNAVTRLTTRNLPLSPVQVDWRTSKIITFSYRLCPIIDDVRLKPFAGRPFSTPKRDADERTCRDIIKEGTLFFSSQLVDCWLRNTHAELWSVASLLWTKQTKNKPRASSLIVKWEGPAIESSLFICSRRLIMPKIGTAHMCWARRVNEYLTRYCATISPLRHAIVSLYNYWWVYTSHSRRSPPGKTKTRRRLCSRIGKEKQKNKIEMTGT